MQNQAHILTSIEENNREDPKFKVRDNVRISKYKNIFTQKLPYQIVLKKFLWLKKLTILCHGHMDIATLKVKKLLEHIIKMNFKKQTQNSVELKK